MDLGTVLSVAQTLFNALQCSELRELCSILGYKSELKKLERTVSIIKAVLDDADSKQMEADLHHQAQLYIEELKDVVYDAEDLLDEFVTLAQREKLMKGGNVSKKVRLLFSRFNPPASAYKMSRGVKEIRKRMDNIANDHMKFGFKSDLQPNSSKLNSRPTHRRKEETHSYVHTQDIIGRNDEVDKIVGRLLNPDVQQDVSCLAIVGIGGLGKTTFAQLVYNEKRIKENFPVRLWTCVSDEDPKCLDLKTTLCKILHSATGQNHEKLAMEHLQRQIQEQLAGKKYFLVLDDVWNENRLHWDKLAKLLMTGLKGSWILVTTRSQKTAAIVGDEHTYKLKGLSEEDSWRLFEMTAFGERYGQAYPFDLVKIGREIVKRCANVPLAIRVIGSLLYDEGKEKWVLFQEMGLRAIKQDENDDIKSILKLSYHRLDSSLKTCFTYCALFPKDYCIQKMLINLWMARGYVVPFEGQSIEDVGEEYFSILLRRCFFQDVLKDEYGEIESCKMHDLMHDIAQEVAGKEIRVANSIPGDLNDSSDVGALGTKELFFPSLEILKLFWLAKLKGWWRGDENIDSNTNQGDGLLLPSFPCVSKLEIQECPNLASMPLCPSVQHLIIMGWNVNLRTMESGNSKLRSVETDNVGHLKLALPMEAFQCLESMKISDSSISNLSEGDEVFRSCSSSLRQLQIWDCSELKSVSVGLKHLTVLKRLELRDLPNLGLSKEEEGGDEDGMPWRSLRHSLQSLEIVRCRQLESVPEWIRELTSLKQLTIRNCSDALEERCRNSTGEDWPKILHIPYVNIN